MAGGIPLPAHMVVEDEYYWEPPMPFAAGLPATTITLGQARLGSDHQDKRDTPDD